MSLPSNVTKAATVAPTKTGPVVAEPARRSWSRTLFGWVVVPSLLAGALIALGVHVGANNPDMWFARLITWIVGLL